MAIIFCPMCNCAFDIEKNSCPNCGCPKEFILQHLKRTAPIQSESKETRQENKTDLRKEYVKSNRVIFKEDNSTLAANEITDIEEDNSWREENEDYEDYIEWKRQFWQYLWENADDPFDIEGFVFQKDEEEEIDGFNIYESFEAFLDELREGER